MSLRAVSWCWMCFCPQHLIFLYLRRTRFGASGNEYSRERTGPARNSWRFTDFAGNAGLCEKELRLKNALYPEAMRPRCVPRLARLRDTTRLFDASNVHPVMIANANVKGTRGVVAIRLRCFRGALISQNVPPFRMVA